MAFSIGGMVSGLDTATMIDQLMQLEARPQSSLKTKAAATQNLVSALQQLNTRISSLGELAEKTAKPGALGIYKGTSSSDKISVVATEEAAAGEIDLEVTSVAKAQVSVSALISDWPESANVLTIALSDGQVDINTDGMTLDQVVTAVNESGAGAMVTKVAAGTDSLGNQQYRLQFTAVDTGAGAAFSVNLDGLRYDELEVQPAADAQVRLWAGTPAEQLVSSASNTFPDLLPGVDVMVSGVTTEKVAITVVRDDEAVTASAKALVDGLADLFSFISKNSSVTTSTSSGSTVSTGGIFTSDSSVRDIERKIMDAATSPIDNRSPSEIGISITKDGTVEFDAKKFEAALKQDSAWAEKVVQEIASRVATASVDASDKYDGAITLRIKGQESLVGNLSDQVSDWDRRLEVRRATLERTWSALEVQLQQLQSQGDYLTSQLASLPSYGSSKS